MKKSIEKKSSKKIVVEKIVLMLDIGGNLVIFPMEKKLMKTNERNYSVATCDVSVPAS